LGAGLRTLSERILDRRQHHGADPLFFREMTSVMIVASIPTSMPGKPTHTSCRRPDRYGPKLDFNDECEQVLSPPRRKSCQRGKRIGWNSFRHSLATNLRALGVDVKIAQELMRHSSCRTTLDIYTRAVDQQKREASVKSGWMDAAAGCGKVFSTLPHPQTRRRQLADAGK